MTDKTEVTAEIIAAKLQKKFVISSTNSNEDLTETEENSNASNEEPDNVDFFAKDNFYKDAKKYWSTIPATVDGMLGGFGNINHTDINSSMTFLNELFKLKPSPGKENAVDCGAGIGRISKHLLTRVFDKVDLVEQDEAFSKHAKEYIGEIPQLGTIYNVGLQSFNPEPKKYNVVWCQWVLGHLTDTHLIDFFRRIKTGLKKDGILVIKENMTSSQIVEVDDTDSSITRPLDVFQEHVKSAGFRIIKQVKQKNLPKGLYPVYMFACKPNQE